MRIFWHDACLGHVTPTGHPECVDRLHAVDRAVRGWPREDMPQAGRDEVLRCHTAHYLDRVMALAPASGWAQLDGDTFLSPGSVEAALRAVGGAGAAVDRVMDGGGQAFVATRPPGHHAERGAAMGFCLFGTVAIAAKRALDRHGLSRVAVLDFDVHHGNGTQDLLWDEDRVRFISSHQMPLYPGSGHPRERGAHDQVVNLPLEPGSGGGAMRAAWAPALDTLAGWAPELVVISAGFDAHVDDPLGGLAWTDHDFRWLTAEIRALANDSCAGRVVSVLEGGYDLAALESAVRVHLEELGT